jgi:hypothetical protein
MEKAVLLAVAASLCTATASVCQRAGARNTGPAAGFDARLIVRLAATMLLAAHALASGPLAASQPGFTILDPLTAKPARGVLVRRAHPDRRGCPGRRGAGAGRGYRWRRRPEPQLPHPRRKPAPGLPGPAHREPRSARPRPRAGRRGPAVTPRPVREIRISIRNGPWFNPMRAGGSRRARANRTARHRGALQPHPWMAWR